jgi:hypothetical protein
MKTFLLFLLLNTAFSIALAKYQTRNQPQNQAKISRPYKLNILLEISKIHHNDTLVIVEYQPVAFNDTSKLPFGLDSLLNVSFYEHVYGGKVKPQYIHRFKTPTNEWRKEGAHLTRFNKKDQWLIPLGFVAGEQVDFGDVLKEIFGCWNPMEKYVSRIFFFNKINTAERVTVYTDSKRRIGVSKFIKIYWSIGKWDSISLNNDANFGKFMEECWSFPLNYLLLGLVFGGSVLGVVGVYGYDLVLVLVAGMRGYRERSRVVDLRRRIAWG